MKKYLLLLSCLLTFQSLAQEKGISYQAVILYTQKLPGTDNLAAAFADKEVCLKFLFKDASGNHEYEEVISTRTDPFGLINVVIGTGERIGGSSSSFGEIVWNTAPKFLAVSLDKEGLCADFIPFSNQEFTAVPFALFAINAGNLTVGPQGIQGETGVQGLTGDSGEQGSQGVTGADGEVGDIGTQGEQGMQGNVGPQGIAGTDGSTGDAGIQGIQGAQGLPGDTGAHGIAGIKGDVGDTGTQGIQGLPGDAGAQGIAGIKGDVGDMGIQGIAGIKGDVGDTGTQGVQGLTGDAGAQGIVGIKGDVGDTGTQGVQGLTGDAGAQGIVGTKGDAGDTGTQGLPGDAGAQGIAGTKGDVGDSGTQGVQGLPGDAGAQGIVGIKGDVGDTGTQGVQGLPGDAGAQGIVGIKGDAGDTGTQGLPGDTGAQGIVGIKGDVGDTGTQGIQGLPGDAGAQGIAGTKGDVGDTGTQGLPGDTGAQGIVGIKGDVGDMGIQGIAGTKGDVGDTGVQGVQGLPGDAGAQGIVGTDGSIGNTGTQGIQGLSGDTGAQGIAGTKGSIGDTGIQGVRGLQGETGIQGLTGASGIAASSASFMDLSTDQSVIGTKTFTNTMTASISGNAATVTTNANLIGAITSEGNNTSILDGAVTNSKLDKANISLSGFGVAEADIALGANKLTELADPVSAQDAATKNYVDRARLISTITLGDISTTTSSQNTLVPGMTLSPAMGTYLVLFNGSMSSDSYFSTTRGNLDVARLYSDLMAVPGGITHPLVFGSEILLPGVYDVTGATSIAGTLTLDGLGDPNSLFIIRSTGAITTGANSVLLLINQANAGNIFWVSEGAISTTAPTNMKGTFVANQAAIALGATTTMEGRMFAVSGALTMGAGSILTKPSGAATIDLGILSTFAMYTAVGAVSDCATCTVTGDVGTGTGVITGFATIDGTVYPAATIPSNSYTSTYGIYQNGVMVPHSERTIKGLDATVSLQALVSLTQENTPIEIRWKVASGSAKIGARNLSLIPSGN